MIYRKNFLVLDYHTTDGSHRTNANLAGWNWKKEKEQEFDSGLKRARIPSFEGALGSRHRSIARME